ncbi:MAG: hemerythrin domain-containing protein [Woeseiaceae bacterium]|nr:hemerythrin domain-containing protein [Woeseiaceae bacterium]
MSNDIAVLLDELHQDHRNMAFLLELLERESNRLLDDGNPDFELMHDIMQYMTGYPDAVHHPKEDRLYAEIKEVRPELTAGFQRISHDHREQGSRAGVRAISWH